MKYVVTVDQETFEIEVGPDGRMWVEGRPYDVDLQGIDGLPLYSLLVDNRSYEAHVAPVEDGACEMLMTGRPYRVRIQQEGTCAPGDVALSRQEGTVPLCAPLPGLVVALPAAVGQPVARGDVVAVIESMKMNLELRAPSDGVVQALHSAPGSEVSQGDLLAVIGPADCDQDVDQRPTVFL